MKKIRRFSLLMFALFMTLSATFSPAAAAVRQTAADGKTVSALQSIDTSNISINSTGQVVVNEYENFKTHYGDADSSKNRARMEYIKSLHDLTKYSKEELVAMNYSDGNIAIIEKMKQNSLYVPSDEELSRAGSTLRFTCVCSGSSVRDTHSWYDFIWSFKWNNAPVIKNKDIIAFHWIEDYVMDENSAQATITYQGAGRTITKDYSSDMKYGIMPNEGACSFTFPVKYNAAILAVKGSGSFTMRCNDHRHVSILLGWAYGQTITTVTDIDYMFGTGAPTISFGSAVDTVVSEYRNFLVTD